MLWTNKNVSNWHLQQNWRSIGQGWRGGIWTWVAVELNVHLSIFLTTWPLCSCLLSKRISFTAAVYAFWMKSKSILHQPKHTLNNVKRPTKAKKLKVSCEVPLPQCPTVVFCKKQHKIFWALWSLCFSTEIAIKTSKKNSSCDGVLPVSAKASPVPQQRAEVRKHPIHPSNRAPSCCLPQEDFSGHWSFH